MRNFNLYNGSDKRKAVCISIDCCNELVSIPNNKHAGFCSTVCRDKTMSMMAQIDIQMKANPEKFFPKRSKSAWAQKMDATMAQTRSALSRCDTVRALNNLRSDLSVLKENLRSLA